MDESWFGDITIAGFQMNVNMKEFTKLNLNNWWCDTSTILKNEVKAFREDLLNRVIDFYKYYSQFKPALIYSFKLTIYYMRI